LACDIRGYPGSIYKAISAWLPDPSTQQQLVARAAQMGRRWSELPAARTRTVLTALIERVEVRADRVDIHLRQIGLGSLFNLSVAPSVSEENVIVSVPAQLRRAGMEIRMLIDGTDPFAAVKPDARLHPDLLDTLLRCPRGAVVRAHESRSLAAYGYCFDSPRSRTLSTMRR
jgi:hypothetical protein